MRLVDDQIITLLVYQVPNIEVNFYQDPNPLFANQMNMLPLQVVNMGRKSTVLGNMTVSAENAEVTNNVSLIGPLDPGGSYTLDSNYMPYQAGDQQIKVVISYTDDFNQAQQITSLVPVTVQEMAQPPMERPPALRKAVIGGCSTASRRDRLAKSAALLPRLIGSGERPACPSTGRGDAATPLALGRRVGSPTAAGRAVRIIRG